MKTYNLDFRYFDGAEWNNVDVEISATSIIQLMKAFIEETQFLCSRSKGITDRQERKYVWKSHSKYIELKELEFPIIRRKNIY